MVVDHNGTVEAPGPEAVQDTDAPKLKPKAKAKAKTKGKGKKRVAADMDSGSEPEYVPKKSGSRSVPSI